MTDENPYVLNANSIQEPPTSLKERLKFLGPGFILSASIVGSGELIATTSLGAKAGFVTFWLIIVSCLLTRRVLYMINLDVCRIKFPSLEGVGVGFIRKISFLESQTIPIGLIVKVAIQLEFGKYAIYSGETTMQAFQRLQGPKIGKAHWTIWAWLALMSWKFLLVGGISWWGCTNIEHSLPKCLSNDLEFRYGHLCITSHL
ncbi:MAG: manganese transport protein [Cyclobacteriaceae bacterium]|jgi:manganese transport protein